MGLRITDRALCRIREIATEERVDADSSWLRIAVVPGGCSGLTYDLGWDTAVGAEDQVTEFGDVRVAVDKMSSLYIDGVELDFSDGLEGKGFHFLNPQAARTCACGESFGL